MSVLDTEAIVDGTSAIEVLISTDNSIEVAHAMGFMANDEVTERFKKYGLSSLIPDDLRIDLPEFQCPWEVLKNRRYSRVLQKAVCLMVLPVLRGKEIKNLNILVDKCLTASDLNDESIKWLEQMKAEYGEETPDWSIATVPAFQCTWGDVLHPEISNALQDRLRLMSTPEGRELIANFKPIDIENTIDEDDVDLDAICARGHEQCSKSVTQNVL